MEMRAMGAGGWESNEEVTGPGPQSKEYNPRSKTMVKMQPKGLTQFYVGSFGLNRDFRQSGVSAQSRDFRLTPRLSTQED